MDVSNIAASLFQATATASTRRAAAPAVADTAGATGGGIRQDTVDFSDLAAALKDDALELFGSLSDEDRATLAGLVDGGAMTAQELNDGLNDAIKTARKHAFWQVARADAEASGGPAGMDPDSLSVDLDRLNAITARREALYASGASPEEMLRAMEGFSDDIGAASGSSGTVMVGYGLRGGDQRFFSTAGEQAAGTKLASLFRSATFEHDVASAAQSFARSYLATEGKTLLSAGR